MLLTLLIVWIVVVPTFVVGGLLLASHVLGRRTRRAGAVDVTAGSPTPGPWRPRRPDRRRRHRPRPRPAVITGRSAPPTDRGG
jgi:hypothetical protein